MTVGNPHDDPLDDVDVRQHTDIHERGASGIDAFERKQRSATSPADHCEEWDVVASDLHDDRVMDKRCKAVCDVERQEASSGVDDVVWSAAECFVSFDSFKRLSEADFAANNNVVLVSVEAVPCAHPPCAIHGSARFILTSVLGRCSHRDCHTRIVYKLLSRS